MGNTMKTIQEVSKETIIIQEFIKKQSHGTELSYNSIEHETGVKMNEKGKSYLRSALRREKREYSCKRGYGIVLADANSTMPILMNKMTKIDKAVKRASKSQKNLQSEFFSSLSEDQQKEILFVGAVFGAIRVASENGKIMYTKRHITQDNGSINVPIPKF